MKHHKFSIQERLKSFHYALNGLKIVIIEEHNARIHITVAIFVIIAGFILNITRMEWLAIVLSIGIVIALEIINSSIETIADFISPEKNEQIKKVKDLAAAAVLTGAITAVAIGLIVFLPKLYVLVLLKE